MYLYSVRYSVRRLCFVWCDTVSKVPDFRVSRLKRSSGTYFLLYTDVCLMYYRCYIFLSEPAVSCVSNIYRVVSSNKPTLDLRGVLDSTRKADFHDPFKCV